MKQNRLKTFVFTLLQSLIVSAVYSVMIALILVFLVVDRFCTPDPIGCAVAAMLYGFYFLLFIFIILIPITFILLSINKTVRHLLLGGSVVTVIVFLLLLLINGY